MAPRRARVKAHGLPVRHGSRYDFIMTPAPAPASRYLHHLLAPLRAARHQGRQLFDLVLPPVCMACRQPVADPDAVCATCWSKLTFIEAPYCARLGTPFSYDLGEGALSAEAIANPPPFERARAAVVYDGVARDIVHAFKFHDHAELTALLARLMVRAGGELLAETDILVPVPLHRWRLWRRRFNQSALLAAAIGAATGLASDPLALRRIRATRQQIGLTGSERDSNVRGAFRVAPEHRAAIAGRNVLLIDDVLTTGATAKACTRALLRAGAARVDILVFARVVGAEFSP